MIREARHLGCEGGVEEIVKWKAVHLRGVSEGIQTCAAP